MSNEVQDEKKPEVLMEFFAVRNRDGHYYRAKGYGGGGATWVTDLKKARIYARPGPARTQITYFATNHPDYGVPKLVRLMVTAVEEVDETARVNKSIAAAVRRELNAEKKRQKYIIESAEKAAKEAQARLDDLKQRYTNGNK